MSDKKASEPLVDFLNSQLDRVNYWLSFAEAKNGALLALNVAALALLSDFGSDYTVIWTLVVISLLASCAVALWSFFPITKELCYKKEFEHEDNLTFWGDIAAYSSETYLNEVLRQYFPRSSECTASRLAQDIANEITSNSKIAFRKYKFFKGALFLDGLAVILGAILCVLA